VTYSESAMKAACVVGIVCLWTGTLTSRPGLGLLGAAILIALAPAAIVGLIREAVK